MDKDIRICPEYSNEELGEIIKEKEKKMPDREKVMSWLEGLAQPDWHEFHSDTEVQVIAESALALLKEQETDIGNLNETVKNLLNTYTEIKAIYGDSVRVVGELVRCKDCKNFRPKNYVAPCKKVMRNEDADENWFCADGERQEGR